MYAVSVDIGGTQTRVACVDDKGVILDKKAFSTDTKDPFKTLKEIKKVIMGFDKELMGVGMSCPGPLDLKNGIVLTPPNLPGWHNYPLKDESERILQLPTFLENDANLAALGESQVGAGKGYKIIQYLTISTGVGGGLVINDEIFIGAHGFAQEIANSILWKDGPQQGQLKPGSLESISSGTAIVKRAIGAGLDVTHAGHVNDLAVSDNKKAQTIICEAKEYLANMIAIIIGIIDPDIVILGGGVAINIENFIEDIEKLVKDKVYGVVKNHINIKSSKLLDDSGLIGGGFLVFSKIRNN